MGFDLFSRIARRQNGYYRRCRWMNIAAELRHNIGVNIRITNVRCFGPPDCAQVNLAMYKMINVGDAPTVPSRRRKCIFLVWHNGSGLQIGDDAKCTSGEVKVSVCQHQPPPSSSRIPGLFGNSYQLHHLTRALQGIMPLNLNTLSSTGSAS